MGDITNIIPIAFILVGIMLMFASDGLNIVFFIGGLFSFVGFVIILVGWFWNNAKKADDWLASR